MKENLENETAPNPQTCETHQAFMFPLSLHSSCSMKVLLLILLPIDSEISSAEAMQILLFTDGIIFWLRSGND